MIRREKILKNKKKWGVKWMGNMRDIDLCVVFSIRLT